MSLLIKGLDMPKLDENEEHLWVPGWIEVGNDGKAIFCTGTHFDPNTIHSYAVEEVPTPHGRLIDADKLVWFIDNHIASGKKWVEFETIKNMINSLPTIIEAEVNE